MTKLITKLLVLSIASTLALSTNAKNWNNPTGSSVKDESIKTSDNRVVDKLEYREGIAYAVGEIKPFTGIHLSKYSGNGNRKFKISYANGLKHGLSTSWHYNGQKESEVIYQKNIKEGIEVRWHYEGQKSEETNYANNNKSGLSTEWYENGQKHKETNFIDGIGVQATWDQKGDPLFFVWTDLRGRILCCILGCDLFRNPQPRCDIEP